jgi:hypothetical protein
MVLVINRDSDKQLKNKSANALPLYKKHKKYLRKMALNQAIDIQYFSIAFSHN